MVSGMGMGMEMRLMLRRGVGMAIWEWVWVSRDDVGSHLLLSCNVFSGATEAMGKGGRGMRGGEPGGIGNRSSATAAPL